MARDTTKNLVFAYYTFQLSTKQNHGEIVLLDGSTMSVEEIIKNKNQLLRKALTEKDYRFTYKKIRLNHKLILDTPPYLVFKIANYKPLKGEKDFHEVYFENEPSVYVVVQNKPDDQKIAIQKATHIFTSVDAVADIIENTFRYILHEYALKPDINNIFDEQEFWALIAPYNNRITSVTFEFVKENNADLYKSLADDMAEFEREMNSHKSIHSYNAPQDGVLENVNQDNKKLNGMVQAASKGTSPIKVRVAGKRHIITTRNKTVTKEFGDLDFETTNPADAIKILKAYFES